MLTITKEKVIEAAAKCSVAKQTLQVLFPEVFEDNKIVMNRCNKDDGTAHNESVLVTIDRYWAVAFPDGFPKGGHIELSDRWNWSIEKLNNQIILKPTNR